MDFQVGDIVEFNIDQLPYYHKSYIQEEYEYTILYKGTTEFLLFSEKCNRLKIGHYGGARAGAGSSYGHWWMDKKIFFKCYKPPSKKNKPRRIYVILK